VSDRWCVALALAVCAGAVLALDIPVVLGVVAVAVALLARRPALLVAGGFLLASAGCSNEAWDKCFRREITRIFPDTPLGRIEMDHPLFRTVNKIESFRFKAGSGNGFLEGLTLNGKTVCVYSAEGLNDTAHTSGCCCCGGNEILNSLDVNVNIFAYALLH